MKTNTEIIKSTPLKNARELAGMLEKISRDDRLRIEGAIAWAAMGRAAQAQDSA